MLNELRQDGVFARQDNIEINFLNVGFPKCGTSSLYLALKKNPYIYLPMLKENFFLLDINEKSYSYFKGLYKTEFLQGKIVGDIETEYYDQPQKVLEYYGDRVKLLFCVRNPVKALFSYYQMAMREMRLYKFPDEIQCDFYKMHNVLLEETFAEWSEKYQRVFCYSKYIQEFLRYYPPEQIKVCIMEEMFQEPGRTLDEIQEYIGLSDEQKVMCDEFPRENEGKTIAKDYFAALLNNEIWEMERELRFQKAPIYQFQYYDLKKEVYKNTVMSFTGNLGEGVYNHLLEYYMDSIKQLENILGKSLKGVWY